MPIAELAFADQHVNLSVRAFSITDGINQLFEAFVTAASPSPDIELTNIVGRPAALRLHTGNPEKPYAVWSGICSHIEQVSVEEDGESIYTVRIMPSLWRTTQRRNFRVFQHDSAVDVVTTVLGDWGLSPTLRLDQKKLPVHEYRVQFGETDYAFFSRMLEEAGVSYIVEQANPRGSEKEDKEGEGRERADAKEQTEEEKRLPSMHLVLADKPGQSARRRKEPITYVGNTEDVKTMPWISKVRVGRAVRAGLYTIAGYDYRSSPELRLLSEARSSAGVEARYEQFHYDPEAFLGEPSAERGARRRPRAPKVDDEIGKLAAQLGLERERTKQQSVRFITNQLDLAPGSVFQLAGHPRVELGVEAGLMVTGRRIEGHVDGEWNIEAEAVIATDPFRPMLVTPKPRVMGVQSAIVVGPRGEEIYTDSLGRVRVQFHWDRYGKRDENSSCWIRVSQAWAGSGYGMNHIPRVGHEVLVDFFEGDPDRPVVVGRAYNQGAQPPDALPKHKTKTTWRSSSSPGGEGHSEISIDDAQNEELLFLRAQRNMKRQVVADDETSVGGMMKTTVRKDETRSVVGKQDINVKGDRTVKVDGNHAISSNSILTQAGDKTGVSVQDGKIVISNGSASIVLDGPNVYVDAGANLRISGGRETAIHGRKVTVDARPEVFLNSTSYLPPEVTALPGAGRGRRERPDRERPDRSRDPDRERRPRPRRPGRQDEAEFSGKDYLVGVVNRSFGTKLKWPKAVRLPPEMDEQLERYGRIGFKGERVAGHLLDADTYKRIKGRFERRIEQEKRRLKRLNNEIHKTFDKNRDHYSELGGELKVMAAAERENLSKLGGDLGEIFRGERGNFIESCKALIEVGKEQAKHIKQLRKDIKATIDREMAYFKKAKREWQHHYNEVKEVVDDIKNLVDNPKDALLDIVLGDDKQMAEDIANLADEFGKGDEVRDFLGLDQPGGDTPGGDRPGRPRRPRRPDRPDRPDRPGRRDPDGITRERHNKRRRFKEMDKSRPQAGKQRERRFKPIDQQGIGQGSNQGMSRGTGQGPVTAQAHGGERSFSGKASRFDGYGGEALAKRGGLGTNDFISTVKQDGPAFLQSPGDGQLMVVPEQGAKALDSVSMNAAMAKAQLTGKPVNTAMAEALSQQGYTVYTREFGDYMGPFIQAAEAAASTA